MRRIALALVLAAALPACAHPLHDASRGYLKLGSTPEDNYERGLAEMNDKHYPEAIRFFEYVKAKYPFNNVSLLSDLRISDIKFAQGRYGEAADSYERFAKDHPSSDQIEYAALPGRPVPLQGLAGRLLHVPARVREGSARDREGGHGAAGVRARSTRNRPTWPTRGRPWRRREEMLAKRELFVGDYYFKRGYWAGAAGRYKGLTETYPDVTAGPACRAQAGAGLRAHEREVPGAAGAAAPDRGAPGEPGARRGGEAP